MHDHGVAGSTAETQAGASADYENLAGFFPHLYGAEHGFMNPAGAPRPPCGWMGRGRGRRFGAAMMFGPNMFPGMPRGGRRGFGGRGRGRGGFGGRRWMGMAFDDEASVSSMTNHLEDCNIDEEDNHSDGEESASSLSSASSSSSSSESDTEDDVVRQRGKKSKKAAEANKQDNEQGVENEGETHGAEVNAADRENATNGRDRSREGGRGKHGKRHGHGHKHRHGDGKRHHHLPPFNPMMAPPPPHHGYFHGPPPHYPPHPGFGYHDDLRHVRKIKKSMKKWRKVQNKAWKLRAKMMARYCMPQFDQDGAALEGEFDFQMPPPWVFKFHQRRFGGHGQRRFCCCTDKEERRTRNGKQRGGRPGDEKRADGTSGDVIDVENDVELQTPMEEVNEHATEATEQETSGSAQ